MGFQWACFSFASIFFLLFHFSLSSVHKKKEDEGESFSLFGLLLHPKTAFIRHFLSCTWRKDCPNKKAINGLEWHLKLRYTQTCLSDSAAQSCFEKVCFLPSSKFIKVRVLTEWKKFCGFFPVSYKDFIKQKAFFGLKALTSTDWMKSRKPLLQWMSLKLIIFVDRNSATIIGEDLTQKWQNGKLA